MQAATLCDCEKLARCAAGRLDSFDCSARMELYLLAGCPTAFQLDEDYA
jgi:hypothetical protein